ncbi:MAG: pyridoxal phosphate-dependent aminotransferase [Burkholderiaceae bacterium]
MRTTIQNLQGSQIRQVVNAALGKPDVLRFWFGESDEVTPQAVRDAAAQSIQSGETFYNQNLGIPELREAIAGYMTRLHGDIGVDRIAVTSSGVNALMLSAQLLIDAGDEVVAVTPVWPNLTQQCVIMGAKLHTVSLTPKNGQWGLDLQKLLSAVTAKTKLLIINAPNNPTGWTISKDEQQAILQHCRSTGTWIVADEVYERLYYEPTAKACAPSFLDIADAEDRLVVAHSFSKTFLMTGWRLGWLVLPPSATPHVSKLIEFNTSCAPTFVQRAGVTAIANESNITPALVAHFRRCRDTLVPLLQALPGVHVQPCKGGMYAFFQIEGYQESLPLAKRLVSEAGLGLAPGSAFAPEGEGWLRWCFASKDVSRLGLGVERLRGWLAQQ